MRPRCLLVVLSLATTSCTAPGIAVTVSEPKVYGDDTVLRALDAQRRRLGAVVHGIRPGDYQESLQIRHEDRTRTTLGVNLADPDASPPTPPAPEPTQRRWWGGGVVPYAPPLLPGLTLEQQIRQRVEASQIFGAYELLFTGDARLLHPRSRLALLRFDLSFAGYADLGNRRRFVVAEFVIRPQHPSTPRFGVYLLSPEYSAMVSHEALVQRTVSEHAAQLLGSWGGIGVSGSRGGRDALREELETLLETPLQFAIHGRAEEAREVRFAFAFGPRRRLQERSRLSPARWFGTPYEIAYELQPGPRTCQVLLLFEDVAPDAPLDLVASVFCDGQLTAEESVDVGRALRGRPLETFDVRCPGALPAPAPALKLSPTGGDLLLDAGATGPAFSAQSEVFLGGYRLRDVQLLGRGRLALRVPPLRPGPAAGRVVTPDQPDFSFQVEVAQ